MLNKILEHLGNNWGIYMIVVVVIGVIIIIAAEIINAPLIDDEHPENYK